eukprot:s3074_g9.t1
MLERPLWVVICALNYAYCSHATFPLDLLRRQPNAIQQQAIDRLRLLVRASDPGAAIEVASSGRKNLVLLARLQELTSAAFALGFSSNPYHEEAAGISIPKDNSWDPRLKPYKSLDASRLKISGTGAWDAAQYIEDELWMAYVEPQVIELDQPVCERGVPNLEEESRSAVLALLQRWDENNLLELHPARVVPRGCEGRLLLPEHTGVRVSITDRSDFYHQFACTYERSRSNLLWPPMELGEFKGTAAYERFVARAKSAPRKIDRTVFGDELGGPFFHDRDFSDSCPVYGAFRSILQGDQLGVEFGISGHTGLLCESGALLEDCTLRADKLPRPVGLFQGLVIDDFFSISQVPASSLGGRPGTRANRGSEAFVKAKETYKAEGLAGSDAKDIFDQPKATVVGAHVDSSPALVQKGLINVASPPEKRLALSWIVLQSAKLAYTTTDLHASVVGGLVSAFCFRRAAMSVLDLVFKTVPNETSGPSASSLFSLPRRHANELAIASALLPVASSNLLSPVSQTVFASDASTEKGAFCSCRVSEEVSKALWLSGDFKGARSFLDPWPKTFLRAAYAVEKEDWEEWLEEAPDAWRDPGEEPNESPERPLAQHFDFIEVCGGSGVLSDEMSRRGFVVGPIIDISYSRQYDLISDRVFSWLLFLIQHRRVRSVAIEPPCTSFSPAAFPAVRSYRQPRGFCQQNPKVWVGNRLAFRGLALLWAALYAEVFGLLETPRRSKMAWLREWLYLLTLPGIREVSTASCAFGSPHQKEFRFLTCNMRPDEIVRRCTRDHPHVRIEGQLTKGTAVYCPGLVHALGQLFQSHLQFEEKLRHACDFEAKGLEEPLANEVVRCEEWSVDSSWKWTGRSHINVLEIASYLQAIKRAARKGGGRFSFLLDSSVALFSTSKGRSSSRALAPLLRKIMAIAIAFGVFPSNHFCPTRLNVSDDPTRSVDLREPVGHAPAYSALDFDGLYKLAELPRLRRWISNWVMLVFGLSLRHKLLPPGLSSFNWRCRQKSLPISLHQTILDFDSTLGFPGEGPLFQGGIAFWVLLLVSGSAPRSSWILVGSVDSHGFEPRHADDRARQERRQHCTLEFGRPVQTVTKANRDRLLAQFSAWVFGKGHCLKTVLSKAYGDPDFINKLLAEYGRALFDAGRPYSHYSETINAIGSTQPSVRRLLSGAWDMAFSWLREEPFEHHVACPFQVLLALLTVCMCWGWIEVAGVLAISWGGICRIGEVLAAKRRDLILPSDVMFTAASVLLRVQEPKTRFRAARHQVAKIEYGDLVELIRCAFEHLPPESKLWRSSPQLLRSRFKQLLSALLLPCNSKADSRALDLGSMRAGGATHLQMLWEDAELTRRRGRWLSSRTMEIYLQESAATLFFPMQPPETKARIMHAANAFTRTLDKVQFFTRNFIPPSTWFYLIAAKSDGSQTGKNGSKGETPLDNARDKGPDEVVRILKSAA